MATPSNCLWKVLLKIKNLTNEKKVGHTTEFHFGIYWWTWKATIYWKNCWSGPVKKIRSLIFTMLHFFKKIKKNIWKYHYFTPVHQKSLGRDRLKLVILGYFMPFCLLKSFLPFYSPKNLKNQNFEEMKRNYLGYHHFTHAYQKLQPHDVQFQRYRVKRTELFVILGHFLPFYNPNNPEKKKILKKRKK